jgi:AcrR family transcriptional regulator
MPKISDEKRNARRLQILEAAWRCFEREGLHATTMDDIVRTSGLSAGAVYSYFKNKDELILAALTTSLGGLRERLLPVIGARPAPAPTVLIAAILAEIVAFTEREGFDLKRIALLGWSESQRNETLRATMGGFYRAFRDQLTEVAAVWRSERLLAAEADCGLVAKALLALILGFVVEAAVIRDVTPDEIARGLEGLGVIQ